ncbi:MAG: CDP-alcohol phosphatidyltransferase family protein [Lachnospiraceae bacterium]|nr:CDP-alcohol phosphatidyltransferase family protein [Lachnospiraceae bacterium]
MIGFYNYTVVLTYIGVAVSMAGMNLACHGKYEYAIFCLVIATICDAFDGKVARTKKDRTTEMKKFGVQIDSLCDLICFGMSPVVLSYQIGLNKVWGICIGIFFVLCGVIRLAYYNVLEEMKELDPSLAEAEKVYHGLPITTIGVIYPLVFISYRYVTRHTFIYVIAAMHTIVGCLYIIDFKLKRPKDGVIAVGMLTMIVLVMHLLHII